MLMKLAGSTWGASGANTLQSSALALCYSAAEYWAPVWSRSAHTSQVDVQLNSTMRLISGALCSTPLPWLPVLSNIEPPALRRKAATDKLVEKIVKHDSWPIQPDILNPPLLQLTSRKPLWLDLQPVVIKSRWRHNRKSAQVVNSHIVCNSTIRQPGFDVSRNNGLCWTVFTRNRDTAVPAEGNGDLQTLIYVLVVRPRRILSPDNTEWQLISATLCGWRRCFVADQLSSSSFLTPLAAVDNKIHTIHIKYVKKIKSLTKWQFQQRLSTQLFQHIHNYLSTSLYHIYSL